MLLRLNAQSKASARRPGSIEPGAFPCERPPGRSPSNITLARFRTKLDSRQLTHILQARIQASDEAAASFEGNVAPCPIEGDHEAFAEADQKVDVGNAPQQPGRKARKPEFAELGDRP